MRQLKIKEIAQKAGVSAGTVDRVLHGRGNVSDKSLRAVMSVLEGIDYRFNLHTSAISLKRSFKIAISMPSPKEGDYWGSIRNGLELAQEEYSDISFEAAFYPYDQFNASSCASVFNDIISYEPDGVIIGPTFYRETVSLCKQLDEAGIPYVFMDSSMPGTSPSAVFQPDQISCGRLIAKLLFSTIENDESVVLVNIPLDGMKAPNIDSRERGLVDYICDNNLNDRLFSIEIDIRNQSAARKALLDFFASHPKTTGVAVLNSRGHIVANILRELKDRPVSIACFDLTPDNIRCLQDDSIFVLLGQRPVLQGFSAFKALLSRLIYRSSEPFPGRTMPIDVVFKENYPYYEEILAL